MSAWSSYYQATSGAGRLSRIIKETKQRQILLDAVTNEIPDPEQLSISRSWASLSGLSDKLSGGTSRQVNDLWKLPLEPYNNLKLWLKFDSGLRCKDWSFHNTRTDLKSKSTRMPIKRLVKDDGITEGQVYNILDGEHQWAQVKHDSVVSFEEIVMNDQDEVTLTIFMSPFGGMTPDDEGYGDLFYKIDSDEVRFAYRARLKDDGSLKFTVVDNYAVYDLVTPPGVVPLYDYGDFDIDDFDPEDFNVEGDTAHQMDPDVSPNDWTIYTFTYNTVTKSMKICSAWINPDDSTDKEVVVEAQTTNPQNTADMVMHLPINEGNGTIVHDATGHANHGDFATPASNAPVWDSNNNGLLKFQGDNQRVTIPNAGELDNLSAFTVAFKIKLTSYAGAGAHDVIFGKSITGGDISAAGGFLFFIPANGSKFLGVDFWDATTYRSMGVPDAIANLNQWYDVVFSYDGTTFNLKVGSVSATPVTAAGSTFTNSNPLQIGSTSHSFQGYITDIHIHNGRAWVTGDFSYFSSLTPGYKGGFPQWEPLPPDEPLDPVPIIRPLTKIYDVPQPASPQEFKLNNPAATTPFDDFYNVPGGSPVEDPELQKYLVADGTSTGGTEPIHPAFYSLTGQSSSADLVWGDGDRGYGQYIRTTGSVINGKRIGRITLAGLKKASGATGTIELGIIKANGTFVAFGASIAASTLTTDTWTSFTRDNGANAHPTTGYACAVGDGVGIRWTSGSGTIYIQRGGSNHFEDNSLSCQATFQDDNAWHITNENYSEAGAFHTGGYSTSVPAEWNMNNTSTSTKCTIGTYQLNSIIEGIVPTRIVWRLKKVGTLTSATLRCMMVNASNASVCEFGTVACSGIGSTLQDVQFINRNNTVAWADNFRICLEYGTVTGVNSSNYIIANYFPGGQVASTAVKAQSYRSASPAGWSDVGPSATDWAGAIYTGGNPFSPWVALTPNRTRIGEVISQIPSPSVGKKLTKATVQLRRVGSASGPVTFKVYDLYWAPVATGFSSINAESISTVGAGYDFTWVYNNYVNAQYTFMVVEFYNADASNYLEVMINTDAAAGAAGEGTKLHYLEWDVLANTYKYRTDWDAAFVLYEGGVPDLSSRNRVGIQVVTEASALKSDKVTEASFYFKIEGTVTGSIEIRSRRGSDDTPRDLLGTIPVSGLNNTTWQKRTVILREAVHFLGVSDKVTIEYNGGNQTNYVRVMMNPLDVFDGDDTQIAEYNSVTWSTPIDNLEIVGELWTGGDEYTPDPGTPWVAPPLAYNHDLFICAGGGLTEGNTGDPLTYTGMRIRDFRIVAGDTAYSMLTSLDNWIQNKHTILPILKGQVALGAYTTARNV